MFRAIKNHSTVDNTLTELVNQVNAAPCNFSASYYSKKVTVALNLHLLCCEKVLTFVD